MQLSDLLDVNDFSMEAATVAPEFRGGGRRRDNATLLDDHRHHVNLTVDHHIRRHTVRDVEIGDGVLAELVKLLLLLGIGIPETFQKGNKLPRILNIF